MVLVFTALIGSSCVSVDQAPEVHGQVTDAATGKSLDNVKITYTRGTFNDDTTSDENGHFSVGPLADHIFFLYAPVASFIGIFNSYELGGIPRVKFEHQGYLPQELNVYGFNGDDFCYDPQGSWKVSVKMHKAKAGKAAESQP